ncbi:unnamed protein product [Owenia fusiformis]|uniref:Carbohydrate sulfotransferase n=1 Tax=Owenia fusiformis TaxID=6347 RepID=A0A8J1Y1V3_OWEFU|nr:unnamed protein product [Owenia fusiformis]
MATRINILREKCLDRNDDADPNTSNTPNNPYNNVLVNDDYQLLLCIVPKAGSSFLKNVMKILENNFTESKNPLVESSHMNKRNKHFKTLSEFNNLERQKVLKNYVKVMFTRNPFSRLFSAYQDKFVSIYPEYWKYGVHFLRKIRKDSSLTCGHDMTLEEFLHFVIDDLKHRGVNNISKHWEPIHKHCDPCMIRYDIIGKLETFQDDLHDILCKIGARDRIDLPVMESLKIREFLIKHEVKDAFDRKNMANKGCLPEHELPKRIVESFVQHGYIEPLTGNSLEELVSLSNENFNETGVTDLILKHMITSNKTHLLNLPKYAKEKALQQIPTELMHALRQIYKNDFELFGYF